MKLYYDILYYIWMVFYDSCIEVTYGKLLLSLGFCFCVKRVGGKRRCSKCSFKLNIPLISTL